MTSLIQVMNSRGLAFATDSAVSSGSYSRNSAQKLFSLPGRQPIAFMIMGSSQFAPSGLHWDRVFYLYNQHFSKKYGAEAELATVDDYEKDFIGFLDSLSSDEDNENALKWDIWKHWAGGENPVISKNTTMDENEAPQEEVSVSIEYKPTQRRGLDSLASFLDGWNSDAWVMSNESYSDVDFQYKVAQVEKYHGETLMGAAKWVMITLLSDGPHNGDWDNPIEEMDLPSEWHEEAESLLENLKLSLSRWLAGWGNTHSWKAGGSKADVIFGGFGKKDKFPKTIRIFTGSRVNGLGNSDKLVYERNIVDPKITDPERDESGVWRSEVFLESFAQNEFINSMTTGASSGLGINHVYDFLTRSSIDGWLHYRGANKITELEGVSDELAESIKSHLMESGMSEEIGKHFAGWYNSQRSRVKGRFWDAVRMLSPVEMADLANELIEVQAKMHNIVNSQASVDLPVDVCYLSKENGFVWHSRKNMPDLQLNPRIKTMRWDGSQLD